MTAGTSNATSPRREPPGVALSISAHPDDTEFGCGATLAKWAAAGTTVHLLVCTDGSKGTWDPDEDLAGLVARRQDEQRAAARVLGATGEVVFLGRVDGELDSGLATRRDVVRVIRELRPEVVLGHDPWKRYRIHPDHRHAGLLAAEAVVAARDPHFYPELGLEPHRPDQLWLFEADEPDHVEDVTGFGSTKVEALLAHRSQHESTMGITGTDDDARHRFRRQILSELEMAGRARGTPQGEAFRVLRDL